MNKEKMDWALLETIRANTLSAGHPEDLVRLSGRKPPPPKWYVLVMITLTVVAFLLGRLT